jgi:hypothetical protein
MLDPPQNRETGAVGVVDPLEVEDEISRRVGEDVRQAGSRSSRRSEGR